MTTTQRVFDLSQGNVSWAILQEVMEKRGYTHVAGEHWTSDSKEYNGALQVLFRATKHSNDTIIVSSNDTTAVARIGIESGLVDINAAAKSLESARKLIEILKAELPPMGREDGQQPVTFWVWGPYGASHSTRRISVPSWEEIIPNYSNTILPELSRLMKFQPSTAGQLLLWRGPPGTGKTWALRSLIWEWREWADFHYIVDPDKLFGQEASYLTSVLFHEDHPTELVKRNGERTLVAPRVERWKVMILEDCGEMLSKDARERSGQGLSRLLNLVDGLIGQGLRILVLVTTNEELGSLHDAISRPGRCAANVAFDLLHEDEIDNWMNEHELSMDITPSVATLAELYAIATGEHHESERLVGFAS